MNNNIGPLVLGTYNLVFSDKDGSERRVVGAPTATPIVMTIKRQQYVDPISKIKGRRTVVRIDKHMQVETGGPIVPLTAYLVVAAPSGTLVTTGDIQNVVADIVRVCAPSVNVGDQLGLTTAIFVTGEQ